MCRRFMVGILQEMLQQHYFIPSLPGGESGQGSYMGILKETCEVLRKMRLFIFAFPSPPPPCSFAMGAVGFGSNMPMNSSTVNWAVSTASF